MASAAIARHPSMICPKALKSITIFLYLNTSASLCTVLLEVFLLYFWDYLLNLLFKFTVLRLVREYDEGILRIKRYVKYNSIKKYIM